MDLSATQSVKRWKQSDVPPFNIRWSYAAVWILAVVAVGYSEGDVGLAVGGGLLIIGFIMFMAVAEYHFLTNPDNRITKGILAVVLGVTISVLIGLLVLIGVHAAQNLPVEIIGVGFVVIVSTIMYKLL